MVNRRTGGLEMIDVAIKCFFCVHRREGGLEKGVAGKSALRLAYHRRRFRETFASALILAACSPPRRRFGDQHGGLKAGHRYSPPQAV